MILGHLEIIEGQPLEIGETPVLIFARRHREGGEFIPRLLFGRDPPGRQVAALGEVSGETFGVEAREGRSGNSGHF